MNRNLLPPLLLLSAFLQTCATGSSTAKRDTADFFTKLSQGYRIHVKAQMPMDAMWVSVEIKDFHELTTIQWAKRVARLTGDIMQRKGVMEGQLFLLFRIQDGEIQGDVKLCQPVENLLAEKGENRRLSRPASKVVRTNHRGLQQNLGTAFRVLEHFARQEGLELTGWGSIRTVRGTLDETDPHNFLTEAQLYVK